MNMKSWHVVLIFGLISFVGFVTRPASTRIEQYRTERTQLQKNLETQIEKLKRAEAVQSSAPEEEQARKRIPRENEQENIIRDLQIIAAETGFGFESLNFSESVVPGAGISKLTITFATSGRRADLLEFLYLVEKNKHFLGMESLSISSALEEGVLSASFGVSLYSFFLR